MKLVNYGISGAEQPGILSRNDTVIPLIPILEEYGITYCDMPQLLAWLPHAQELLEEAMRGAWKGVAVPDIRLGPPVPRPGLILAAGGNYAAHTAEVAPGQEQNIPSSPVFFAKAPTAISGPYDSVVRPPETAALDYECELAVVIGRGGHRIPRAEALSHVAGYMIANDVTARDVFIGESKRNPIFLQSLKGKGFPTFCPTGPWLLTADEVPDPRGLRLRTWVNDELRQDAEVADMIFDIPTLISEASTCFRLRPGDVILTGTPAGVGFAMNPPRLLAPGDVIEMEITGLGIMTTTVVDE
ncbi:fumarylacetoacetate hydrolase family protein [Streptomyces sp. NPDC085932]|uniref:fumarylacetoacetate hydrolase family protein n=1 Tax=Streptomyces sp. NPDC085932 TaxID=3365741 RepID=UPI0037D4E133